MQPKEVIVQTDVPPEQIKQRLRVVSLTDSY
jgi:hypothetical protein